MNQEMLWVQYSENGIVVKKGRGLLTCLQESPKARTLIKDEFIGNKDRFNIYYL